MLFYTYVVRMGSEHENPGRFALDRKKKPFEKTIIFFSDKQFVQKNKCNLYKKAIFFIQNCCRTPYGVRGFKWFENIRISFLLSRTPYGVRGFKLPLSPSHLSRVRRTPYGVRGFKCLVIISFILKTCRTPQGMRQFKYRFTISFLSYISEKRICKKVAFFEL